MRVAFLPIILAALGAISPVLAQDTATDAGAGAAATDSGATDTGSAAAAAATGGSGGGVTPTEPSGNTLAKAGSNLTTTWTADQSGTWDNMTIQLMTGSNENMIALTDIATSVDGTTATSYTFQVPQVHPYSKIYFLQFTNPGVTGTLWTTRFTIASADGGYTAPPNNETTSAGEVVGWGDGALGEDLTATTSAGGTVQSGSGANGVTLYNAGLSSQLTSKPTNVAATGVAVATQGATSGAFFTASPAAAVVAIVAAAALLV